MDFSITEWAKWTGLFLAVIAIIVAAVTAVAGIETSGSYWAVTIPAAIIIAGGLAVLMLKLQLPSKGS